MQRKLHTAKGEICLFQAFPGAQALNGLGVPLLAGEYAAQVLPHPLTENLPGIAVRGKKVRQQQALSALQVPGAGGEIRGALLLPETCPRNGQGAQVLRTGTVVYRINIQRAAALAFLPGVHFQGGRNGLVIAVHQCAEGRVDLRVDRGHIFFVNVGAAIVDFSLGFLHHNGENLR